MKRFKEFIKKSWSSGRFIAGTCILLLTILIIRALLWKESYFNTVDFEQILYNLLAPMDGANTEVFSQFTWQILPSAILICIIVAMFIVIISSIYVDESEEADKIRKWCKPIYFVKRHYLAVNIALFIFIAVFGMIKIGAIGYVWNRFF